MAKVKYQVNGRCVLCMTCLYSCPRQAIELIEDVSAKINQDKCVGCGLCAQTCQPNAIVKVEVEEK
ncbi:MAG: 4Fe-4S dicluster domain-containing protein [Clostridiales bacterium]|nr:4Fe-4S dicluster domain-containing protein [Clostridiales bacterium]